MTFATLKQQQLKNSFIQNKQRTDNKLNHPNNKKGFSIDKLNSKFILLFSIQRKLQ